MSPNTEAILNLVMDADERTAGMMPGWDIELARQKMLFFTPPKAFPTDFESICHAFDAKFGECGSELRQRATSFVVSERVDRRLRLPYN